MFMKLSSGNALTSHVAPVTRAICSVVCWDRDANILRIQTVLDYASGRNRLSRHFEVYTTAQYASSWLSP